MESKTLNFHAVGEFAKDLASRDQVIANYEKMDWFIKNSRKAGTPQFIVQTSVHSQLLGQLLDSARNKKTATQRMLTALGRVVESELIGQFVHAVEYNQYEITSYDISNLLFRYGVDNTMLEHKVLEIFREVIG